MKSRGVAAPQLPVSSGEWLFGLLGAATIACAALAGSIRSNDAALAAIERSLDAIGLHARPGGQAFPEAFGSLFERTRPSRPVGSLNAQRAERDERRLALLNEHFPEGTGDRSLELRYRVDPDGRVAKVEIEHSTFDDPAFEKAFIEELKTHPFPPAAQYRPTWFSFYFKPQLAPRRRLRERDLDSVQATLKASHDRIQSLYRQFTATQRAPSDAFLDAELQVEPDGSVSDTDLKSSTFGNPALEKAVLDALRTLRFDADASYAAGRFTYRLENQEILPTELPNASDYRPASDLEESAGEQRRRLAEVYGRFYSSLPAPGAELRATYTVLPDGSVTDVRIDSSTFDNAPFEAELRKELASLRYPPRPGLLPTPFTIRFGHTAAIADPP